MKQGEIIEKDNFIKLANINDSQGNFVELPFFGLAMCGEASALTEDLAEGYLKISKSILPQKAISDFYIIQASGNSMNDSHIGKDKKNIEDSDFVVVDKTKTSPLGGEYVVSVIDGYANIKKYEYDPRWNQINLLSESTDICSPIILHEYDNFNIVGEVIDVIKNLKSR